MALNQNFRKPETGKKEEEKKPQFSFADFFKTANQKTTDYQNNWLSYIRAAMETTNKLNSPFTVNSTTTLSAPSTFAVQGMQKNAANTPVLGDYVSILEQALAAYGRQRPMDISAARKDGADISTIGSDALRRTWQAQEQWDRAARASGLYDSDKYLNEQGVGWMSNKYIQSEIDRLNQALAGRQTATADELRYMRDTFGLQDDVEAQQLWLMARNDPEAFSQTVMRNGYNGVLAPVVTNIADMYKRNTPAVDKTTVDLNKANLSLLEGEQKRRTAEDAFYNNQDFSSVRGLENYDQLRVYMPGLAQTGEMWGLYQWLNDPNYREQIRQLHTASQILSGGTATYEDIWANQGYGHWSPEEIADFNAILVSQGEEAADRYASSLMATGMPQRRRAYEQVESYKELASDPLGQVAMYPIAAAANFTSGLLAPAQIVMAAFGYDNPNSSLYDYNRMAQVPRQTIGQNIFEWGQSWGGDLGGQAMQFVYNGANALLDMAIARGMGGAGLKANNPKLAGGIVQGLMSSQAAGNTLYNELQNGTSSEGAVAKAILAGAVEAFTEKYSIDAFMKNPGTGIKYFLQNMLTEGAEEGTATLLNTGVDELVSALTGDTSELTDMYNQGLMKGLSSEAAAMQALGEYAKNLGTDVAMGGFVGGVGAAPGAVGIYAANTQTGQRVLENDAADQLLALAETMPEGSESRKVAENIRKRMKPVTKMEAKQAEAAPEAKQEAPVQQEQAEQAVSEMETTTEAKQDTAEAPAETAQNAPQEAVEEQTADNTQEAAQAPETKETPKKKGKRISPAKLGQLYRTLYNDLDAQGKQTVSGVMESSVKGRLAELGEDQASIDEVAAPLAKLLADDTLTNKEKQIITKSKNGLRVFNEIRFAEDDTYSSNWVGEAGRKSGEAMEGNLEARVELERMLAPKVLRPAVEAAQRTVAESGMAVANAKHGTDAKLGVQLTGEGGKTQDAEILQVTGVTKQGMQVKVKGSDGQTKTVDMADMKFANRDTATIAAYIQKAPHVFTAEEANKMMQTYMGGDVQEHISGFTTLYNAGYAGRAIPPSKLPQAQVIYDLGKQDAATDEANRLKGIGTGKRGTGKVTFAPGVQRAGLNKVQRNSEYALRLLGKAAGIDFVLYESAADTEGNYRAANGRYQNNTIFLDLNSGKNNKNDITEYAILRTAAHEITHYVEHNSAEGYARLKDYVKSEYARKGKSWDNLVEDKLATRTMNSRLTRAGAEAEVMADAMEMMLQDSKAIERLQKRDQTLYEKIKRFIVDYFRKVREAFTNVGAVHKEAKWLMEEGADGVMHYAEKMVHLWDEALVEAVETVQGKTETSEQMPEPVEQFALRNTVEQRKDGLVAVHNLSANKFMDTLQLGGFPMPSIAIIKAEQGHDMYGDISVVFGPESIDPQANKANRVYGNDAWTPTFPHVETEIDSDELYKAEMDIEEAANKVDAELGKKSRMFFGNFGGTDVTSKTMEDIVDSAWNNQGVLAAYLMESGKPVEVLTKEVDAERPYNPAKAQQYDMILDIIDTTDYATMPMYEFLNTYGDKLSAVSGQMARLNAYWKKDDRRAGASMARIIKEAIEYEGAGRDVSEKKTTVKDFDATRKAMEAKADRAEFDAWIAQKLSSAFGQQGIYNGKDRFTPSGNRRSFKQTHYEYNVENVVRSMLQEQESAIPAVNASGLKAAASSRYGSLDDIRSDAYRLGKVSEEQFNALMAKADNDLHDFFNAIEAWDYDIEEEAGNLLVKAAKQKLNASGIAKLFKANGFTKATVNAAKIAESVIKQVQTIPTGYFEAKPARVVSFDEVRMVVAPDTMPVKLANMLDERGIPYTTYDGTEADRLEKLNAVEDVQFSQRDTSSLLNAAEYKRLQDNWNDYKLRGYQFVERANGGIVVDFDYMLVYTDNNGNPERLLIVPQEPRELNNDIIKKAQEMEERGLNYEAQRRTLGSLFPKGSFNFVVPGNGNKNGRSGKRLGSVQHRNGVRKNYRADMPTERTPSTFEIKDDVQESRREVTGQVNMWDYMAELDAQDATTGEERAAIENYKRVMGDLRQAIADRNQYKEALRNAATPTERGKALGSLQVATKRLDRAYDQLSTVMKNPAMKTIEQRSTAFVQEYLDGKTLQDVAELIDLEEAEIKRLAGKNEKEAQKHREIVRQLRSKATENLLKEREKFHNMMDRDRRVRDMNMKAAQHRKHLAAQVKKLDGLIRHETDYKHVPEELKPLVETFVGAFAEKGAGIVFNKQQADKLSSVYRKLLQTDGSMNQLGYLYEEDVMAKLDELNDLLEDELAVRSGKGMTMEERAANRLATMENLSEIADSVYGMVKNANELFYGGKKAQFAAIGTEAMQAMEQRQDYRRLKGKAGENVEAVDNFMRAGNMTPVYFFDRLKNKVFKTLYGDMLAAQDEYAFRVEEARQFWQATKEKYHYDSWADDTALTMKTEKGKKLTLDKEDAMSVYATWKREHADELLPSYHLEDGGIVLEGNQMQDDDKKYLVAVRTTPTTLTQNDMAKIHAYLTEEQRAYADAVVEYMSTTMADYGNETSMELYGIKKYKESYYFPMKTAGDQQHKKSTAGGGQVTDDNRVKHRSFTKARVRGAATSVVIGKFSQVAAMHMEQMILYSTMTVPIESMNRVLNYKHQFEDGSKTTVRALMEQKYGPVMKKYMETFLNDMNGGIRRDSREAGLNKLVSLFKRGSVLASASVAVQQPTAIARATAMISPKHLIATTVPRKGDYDELKKHSGVAILKSMGKFDVDMGAATAEWMLEADEGSYSMWQKVRQATNIKDFETFKKRWNAIFTWAPGKADEMTWAWLWRAVKAEQAEAHPEMNVNSDAFLDVCGERFNDIVNHTQVYDSTLVRSQNMRSKSGLMQSATSFMSEPTLTANMLYDAVTNKERGKQYAVRAVTAALVSQILTSLAQALVSAGRDEDEKKTWAEKYAGKAAGNLASNLNPMSMLPLLRDIQSLIDGYDVTRADMSIFTEIFKAFGKLDDENISPYRKAEDLGGSLAKLLGIPAKNIMRDLRSFTTTFFGNADRPTSGYAVGEAVKAELLHGYDTKDDAYYQKLYNAMARGDQKEAETIREYLVTVLGKKETSVRTGLQTALKQDVLEGDVAKDEAIKWLMDNGLKDKQSEAYKTVDEWIDKAAHADEEGYSHSMYGDFLDNIPTGGKAMVNAAKELLANGVDKTTIAKQIAERYKDQLIELNKQGKAADLLARLLSAYEAIGYDREYELNYIKKNWLKAK